MTEILNSKLIIECVETKNTQKLISLFEFLKNSRDQAELRAASLERQILLLERATQNITREITSETKSVPTKSSTSSTKPLTKKSNQAIDLDL